MTGLQVDRPAVLVGSSLGASTALDFALHHPEATTKLVLMGPAAWNQGLMVFPWLPRWAVSFCTKVMLTTTANLRSNLHWNTINMHHSLFCFPIALLAPYVTLAMFAHLDSCKPNCYAAKRTCLGLCQLPTGLCNDSEHIYCFDLPSVDAWAGRPCETLISAVCLQPVCIHKDRATFLQIGGCAGWSEAIMAFVRGGGYHLRSEMSKLEMQTLVVWGRNDSLVNPKFADKYQENIKQCQVVMLGKCGHLPSIEQPAETANLLLDFVASGVPVHQ